MVKIVLAVFIVSVFFALGSAFGYFIGKNTVKSAVESGGGVDTGAVIPGALFNSQSASITGEIISVNGDVLTVKNLNNGVQGDLKTSDAVTVINPNVDKKSNSIPSASLSNLELNKKVLISLELKNGVYEVKLIQYVNTPPSLPPIPRKRTTEASPSANN